MSKFMTIMWPPLSAALATVAVLHVMLGNHDTASESKHADYRLSVSDTNVYQQIGKSLVQPSTDSARQQVAASIKPSSEVDFKRTAATVESNVPTEVDSMIYQQALFAKSTELLATHDRESRNNIWASHLEATIREQLTNLPQNITMKLERVDCRSSTCLAVVDWPSVEQASEEARVPSRTLATLPCGIRGVPQSAPPVTGPYQATLYLDCVDHGI